MEEEQITDLELHRRSLQVVDKFGFAVRASEANPGSEFDREVHKRNSARYVRQAKARPRKASLQGAGAPASATAAAAPSGVSKIARRRYEAEKKAAIVIQQRYRIRLAMTGGPGEPPASPQRGARKLKRGSSATSGKSGKSVVAFGSGGSASAKKATGAAAKAGGAGTRVGFGTHVRRNSSAPVLAKAAAPAPEGATGIAAGGVP